MSAQVHAPEQEQIDHWLKVSREWLRKKREAYEAGYYREHDLPPQGLYTSLAELHADLGRARFLNGEPIGEVRAEFAEAARCVLKSFRMAYDPADPDYVGDKPKPPDRIDPGWGHVDWSQVNEVVFTDGAHWALMAADFALARELAEIYRDPPDPRPDDEVTLGHARLLAAALREAKPALQLARVQMEWCTSRKLTEAYEENFCTLSRAVAGIVRGDGAEFNAGLAAQLESYRAHLDEVRDTDEEFICDAAVALANLGLHRGLAVTVTHPLLPPGLLIQEGRAA